MFRRELLIALGLALTIFFVVVLLTSLAVRQVQVEGIRLTQDTLPGLVYAGEALNRMNENWLLANRLVSPGSEAEKQGLIPQITANSTDAAWAHYKEAIFEAQDQELYGAMEGYRKTFLDKRVRFFGMVEAGNTDAAKAYFEAELRGAFADYRRAAVALFNYNVEAGKQNANRLINLYRWMPLELGGLCVLILLAGVLIGFKAALGAFTGGWEKGRDRGASV